MADFLADLETSGLLKDEVACLENGTEPDGAKEPKLPQGAIMLKLRKERFDIPE